MKYDGEPSLTLSSWIGQANGSSCRSTKLDDHLSRVLRIIESVQDLLAEDEDIFQLQGSPMLSHEDELDMNALEPIPQAPVFDASSCVKATVVPTRMPSLPLRITSTGFFSAASNNEFDACTSLPRRPIAPDNDLKTGLEANQDTIFDDFIDSLMVDDGDAAEATSGDAGEMNFGAPQEQSFRRFRPDQWTDRFQELADFRADHGHCCVPHSYPPNEQLAQWVKRQRYQYTLKISGRHSTLTASRQHDLESIGFVWDSHKANWLEKYGALEKYRAKYGTCMVPTHYEDQPVAIWVKAQRRQLKLLRKGKRSTMTEERFELLDSLGFAWNPRNL